MAYSVLVLFDCRQTWKCAKADKWMHKCTYQEICLNNCFLIILNTLYFSQTVSQSITALRLSL